MTTNHPVPTPLPAEPAPSLRPVEELQALCDAATDGPRRRSSPNNIVRGVDSRGAGVYIAEPLAVGNRANDADFIAAARTALPALLARLRAAEETLAAVGALAEEWRYKGEFGWGSWQEGHGPDESDYALDQASAELRAALAEGASR